MLQKMNNLINDYKKHAREILSIIDKEGAELLSLTEAKELLETIREGVQSADFYIDAPSAEWRVIHSNAIREIYQDEQEELIKDGYLDGKELPWWFAIDWEKTVQNVLDSDGYGHHFSHYDGSEYETNLDSLGGFWYIFRTN